MDKVIIKVKKCQWYGVIGKSFTGCLSGGDRYWYDVKREPAGLTETCWEQTKNEIKKENIDIDEWTILVVRTDINDNLIDIYTLDDLKR